MADQNTQLLARLAQLAALTDAVTRLRENQDRAAQAAAARRAAEQLRLTAAQRATAAPGGPAATATPAAVNQVSPPTSADPDQVRFRDRPTAAADPAGRPGLCGAARRSGQSRGHRALPGRHPGPALRFAEAAGYAGVGLGGLGAWVRNRLHA